MKTYPVIHFLNEKIALEQVSLAKRCGADGVFLISHRGNDDELGWVALEARKIHLDYPIGINLLTRKPQVAAWVAMENGLDMVWADDMGVDSNGVSETGKSMAEFAVQHPMIKLFASVAFKYQANEPHPALAARNALDAGFIPTTSGSGTGSAPDLEKIISMSKETSGCLAVASGMTPDNIDKYAPYLSYALVATGISVDEHHLDEKKLRRFIKIASKFSQGNRN